MYKEPLTHSLHYSEFVELTLFMDISCGGTIGVRRLAYLMEKK